MMSRKRRLAEHSSGRWGTLRKDIGSDRSRSLWFEAVSDIQVYKHTALML